MREGTMESLRLLVIFFILSSEVGIWLLFLITLLLYILSMYIVLIYIDSGQDYLASSISSIIPSSCVRYMFQTDAGIK